jgi:hypothetical protein
VPHDLEHELVLIREIFEHGLDLALGLEVRLEVELVAELGVPVPAGSGRP